MVSKGNDQVAMSSKYETREDVGESEESVVTQSPVNHVTKNSPMHVNNDFFSMFIGSHVYFQL